VRNADAESMRRLLHDLCQPLTALECLLYLSSLARPQEMTEGEETLALRRTIDDGMVECRRMFSLVRSMQEQLTEDQGAGTPDKR
jgi:signal transduction histidine kinase